MGRNFSSMFGELISKEEYRAIMLGLDAAGKTKILYQLRLGEAVTTIPTIGFNVENVQTKKTKFVLWDVGGNKKIRPLWRHYYANTQGIIFVVDLGDKDRMEQASNELKTIIAQEENINIPILIFGNKSDLPYSLSIPEVVDKLQLNKIRQRQWYIQACCAVTGEGLNEGMHWLSAKCLKK